MEDTERTLPYAVCFSARSWRWASGLRLRVRTYSCSITVRLVGRARLPSLDAIQERLGIVERDHVLGRLDQRLGGIGPGTALRPPASQVTVPSCC
jgi:hypothetical protein